MRGIFVGQLMSPVLRGTDTVPVSRVAGDNRSPRAETDMNPFLWPFRARMSAVAVTCFALIGFAVYSQLHWGLDPCPLCIFQRLAFAALGVVALGAGLLAPSNPGSRRTWALAAAAVAGIGAGIAGRHLWIQLFPPPIPMCGPPLDFLRETLSTANLIRRVLTGSGDCGNIDWTLLGLSMPAWALVWFVLLGIWSLLAGFPRSVAVRPEPG